MITRYTVRHRGVPLGTVELEDRELSAGSMTPTASYASIQPVVREGSAALLRLGFFGAAMHMPGATDADDVPLRAAAELQFDLVDADQREVPATFVNLIEPPGDGRVVVLARLSHAHASVGAERKPPIREAGAP